MERGKVNSINGNNIKINEKGYQFRIDLGNIKEGDMIEFNQKNGNVKNIRLLSDIEEKGKEKMSENKIEKEIKLIDEKEENNLSIKLLILKDKFKEKSNDLIDKFIKEKFEFEDKEGNKNFKTLDNAQFSALQGELKKIKFDINSNEIIVFIDNRIARKKAEGFYKNFKSNFIEKREEFLEEFEVENETKLKNYIYEEMFLLLKKYYRYKKYFEGEN